MNDLALLVPSRGRPQNIERLINAMSRTCRGDTTLLIGLDQDDPELDGYGKVLGAYEFEKQRTRNWLDWQVQPDLRGVVAWVNYLASQTAADFRFLGTIGDDNVPMTDGWDVRVIKSLERQGTGFCFADDGYPLRRKGTLCCHVFMTSDIVRELGYFGPPMLKHMYVDPVWMIWGRSTSIEFLDDVLIEHLHFSAGKSQADETYRYAERQLYPDLQAFNRYCNDAAGLRVDVARIRVMKGIDRPLLMREVDEYRRALGIPH